MPYIVAHELIHFQQKNWMGYKITEQYFKKSANKKQAIKDIVDIKDYKEFLQKSGYLSKYLK